MAVVRAIRTSCGFLAMFQRELAAAVPVVSSALLQVPLAAHMIGADRRVAIVTGRDELTERHFSGVGWSPRDISVDRCAGWPAVMSRRMR